MKRTISAFFAAVLVLCLLAGCSGEGGSAGKDSGKVEGKVTRITAWNEFVFALILVTKDSMRTAPVAISMFPGQYTVPWGDMAAASVIATVPIVLVVLIA